MTSSPFPTNSTATVVNKGIDGVFKVATQMAEAALIAEFPVLANPILEKIDDTVIELVANKIYQQFALFVTFEIIDVQVGGEVSDEKKALIALKAAQKLGDKNAESQALSDFQKACVHLTVIDGAAQPGNM